MGGGGGRPSENGTAYLDSLGVEAVGHASSTGFGRTRPEIRGSPTPRCQLLTVRARPPKKPALTKERSSIVTSVGRATSTIHHGCPSRRSIRKSKTCAAVTAT